MCAILKNLMLYVCFFALVVGSLALLKKCLSTPKTLKVIRLYVCDSETEEPIQAAEISFSIYMPHKRGQRSVPKDFHFTTTTDTGGIALCEVPAGDYYGFRCHGKKTGYLDHSSMLVDFADGEVIVKRGNDNKVMQEFQALLCLQKLPRAIPMYRGLFQTVIPSTGIPYGVDLTCNDLVEPYGKGKHAHLFLQLDFTENPVQWWERTVTLTITFPGQNDVWLMHYNAVYDKRYKVILHARGFLHKANGLNPAKYVMNYTVGRQNQILSQNVPREPILLRLCTLPNDTITEPQNNVSPANYACIRNPFFSFDRMIKFEYWMNPTPDDRNLNPMDDVTLVGAQTAGTEQPESSEEQP